MYVLELTFTAPPEAVEPLVPQHLAWLDEHYAAGDFLASGLKEPPDGGVIIALAAGRATAERLTTKDPFVVADVCTYRITEFTATKTAPALAAHREQPAG